MSASRCALLLLVLSLARSASADVLIDSFEAVQAGNWPMVLTAPGSDNRVDANIAGVLGGWRETTATASSMVLPGLDLLTVNIVPQFFVFDFASSSGTDAEVSLLYAGDPANAGLHADLTADALVRLDFADFDLAGGAPLPVQVTLASGPQATASLTKLITSPGAQLLDFAFTEFAQINVVDLSDVTSITVDFFPEPAVDFRLTSIAAVVPEPATLGLMAVGFLALAARRRS